MHLDNTFLIQFESVPKVRSSRMFGSRTPRYITSAQSRYERNCIYSTAHFSDANTPSAGTIQTITHVQQAAGFCGFLVDRAFPKRGISNIWMWCLGQLPAAPRNSWVDRLHLPDGKTPSEGPAAACASFHLVEWPMGQQRDGYSR